MLSEGLFSLNSYSYKVSRYPNMVVKTLMSQALMAM